MSMEFDSMDSEDLDSQLNYIYSGALAVASARIHYAYMNKSRKNCMNMSV